MSDGWSTAFTPARYEAERNGYRAELNQLGIGSFELKIRSEFDPVMFDTTVTSLERGKAIAARVLDALIEEHLDAQADELKHEDAWQVVPPPAKPTALGPTLRLRMASLCTRDLTQAELDEFVEAVVNPTHDAFVAWLTARGIKREVVK